MGNAFACTPGGGPSGGWYNNASGTGTLVASNNYQMTPRAPWKWTRINLKTNSTSSGTTNASRVDPAFNANALVCWNGASELATNLASCSAVNPNYLPVYVMTTLAVTPRAVRVAWSRPKPYQTLSQPCLGL
jgi:hypothetical protein